MGWFMPVVYRKFCLVETMPGESEPLTVEGVSQHPDGGFFEKVGIFAGGKSRTRRAFEPADEAFDLPAPAIGVFAQVFLSHGRTPGSSQRAIALVPGRFDDAFHTPFSPAEFMDPAGIIARIGIEQWP